MVVAANVSRMRLGERSRRRHVIVDADLAQLYGVSTKALNQAIKRNKERFPGDFVFQLRAEEKIELVTNCDHLANLKYSSYLPYAFTEYGALMAANVLKSDNAVKISVYVVRAFVRLREMVLASDEFDERLKELEKKVAYHDKDIRALVLCLRQFLKPKAEKEKREIGFTSQLPS